MALKTVHPLILHSAARFGGVTNAGVLHRNVILQQ